MKRLTLFYVLLVSIGWQFAMAQTVEIRGTIKSQEDGQPLPGASIGVKGTNIGTTSDLDGKYSLSVPLSAKTLEINFVGLKSQDVEIGGRSVIDVVMEPEAKVLGEVVVTALGVKRDQKALGYSVSQVSGEDIQKSGTFSALNALEGKIAGVNISTASGAPGASTKVILRGYSSIGSSNSPLFVVDGVPINNSETPESPNQILGTYSTGGANGVDFGNQANDVNPNDIASVSVLKGAAATVLYGSRAANGVIIISTKSGIANEKMTVEYTGGMTFSNPLRLPQEQSVFGQGWSGIYDLTQNGSWGPKFDGVMRTWGNVVNGQQLIKPYSAQKNNLKDFYETGRAVSNDISIKGGGERTTYYMSYSNSYDDGIVPTTRDNYKRNTIMLKGSAKSAKLTSTASLQYINKNGKFVPTGQSGAKGAFLYGDIIQTPVDLSIVDLKDYNNKFNNLDNFYTPFAGNPWYNLSENSNTYTENRVVGSIDFKYDANKWLSLEYRIGGDYAGSERKDWVAIAHTLPSSPNGGNVPVDGSVEEYSQFNNSLNSDLILSTKNQFGNIQLNTTWGYGVTDRYRKGEYAGVSKLDIPFFYSLDNSSTTPVTSTDISQRRLYGVYGQADLSYKSLLFLSFNARNDWSSTLPVKNNSFFYPGANLSFVFTELLPSAKDILSFGKLRVSWGKVGNDAPPYSVNQVLIKSVFQMDYGKLRFPLGGVNGYTTSTQIGNQELKPELSTDFEAGTNLMFFQDRIAIDLSYYKRNTTNQIYPVPVAGSTGYRTKVLNFGNVENKGIELMVNLVPVKTKDFQWDLTVNYTRNRNKVISMTPELKQVVITNAYDVDFLAIPGQPLGVFRGPVVMKDSLGRTVVGPNGIPLNQADKGIYGNAQNKYQMYITNGLKYKNLSLSFVFDIRQGGLMYSETADLLSFTGNGTQTTFNYRQPFIVPNSVQLINGKYVENLTPVDMTHMDPYYYFTSNPSSERNHILDKSYVKLRELTISYTLPNVWFNRTFIKGLQILFTGRNLFLWTPSSNNFIDPETTTFGNDLAGEFGEFSSGPSIRSYGFTIHASF